MLVYDVMPCLFRFFFFWFIFFLFNMIGWQWIVEYQTSELKSHSVKQCYASYCWQSVRCCTQISMLLHQFGNYCLSPVLKTIVWQLWTLLNQQCTGLSCLNNSNCVQSLRYSCSEIVMYFMFLDAFIVLILTLCIHVIQSYVFLVSH